MNDKKTDFASIYNLNTPKYGVSNSNITLDSILANNSNKPVETGLASFMSDLNTDLIKFQNFSPVANQANSNQSSSFGNFLRDKNMASNVAGLASSLASLVSLPEMLKNAKLTNKSLAFNLNTAKDQVARDRQNRKDFGAVVNNTSYT